MSASGGSNLLLAIAQLVIRLYLGKLCASSSLSKAQESSWAKRWAEGQFRNERNSRSHHSKPLSVSHSSLKPLLNRLAFHLQHNKQYFQKQRGYQMWDSVTCLHVMYREKLYSFFRGLVLFPVYKSISSSYSNSSHSCITLGLLVFLWKQPPRKCVSQAQSFPLRLLGKMRGGCFRSIKPIISAWSSDNKDNNRVVGLQNKNIRSHLGQPSRFTDE